MNGLFSVSKWCPKFFTIQKLFLLTLIKLWSLQWQLFDKLLTIQYVALSKNCPEWMNKQVSRFTLGLDWKLKYDNMYFWECILWSDHWPIRIWLRILKIYSEDYVVCVSVAIPSSADWNVRINHGNEKCIIMLRLRMYFEFTIENVIVCFNPSEVRSLISWLE